MDTPVLTRTILQSLPNVSSVHEHSGRGGLLAAAVTRHSRPASGGGHRARARGRVRNRLSERSSSSSRDRRRNVLGRRRADEGSSRSRHDSRTRLRRRHGDRRGRGLTLHEEVTAWDGR